MRGDIAHTFGTLLTPASIALVALGFYLLGSAFAHPLTADSAVLLTASIVLSLGFLLLSYLLRSAVIATNFRHSMQRRGTPPKSSSRADTLPAATHAEEHSTPPASHRLHVDSARYRR